jgi:hypothetical protein
MNPDAKAPPTTASGGNTDTVTFDVGGKVHRVFRSLIEQHAATILARLISDTWQSVDQAHDAEHSIFIDRNGDRFAYVLDFLRYGRVILPYYMPKDLFLLDLDFYGISGVPDDSVTNGHAHFGTAQGVEELQEEKANLESCMATIELKLGAIIFASHCFGLYSEQKGKGDKHVTITFPKNANLSNDVLFTYGRWLHEDNASRLRFLNQLMSFIWEDRR